MNRLRIDRERWKRWRRRPFLAALVCGLAFVLPILASVITQPGPTHDEPSAVTIERDSAPDFDPMSRYAVPRRR